VSEDSAVTSSSPQKRAGSSNQIGAAGKLSNGTRLSPLPRPFSPENAGGEDQDDTGVENGEDSYQLVNGGDEEGEEEEEEEEAPVDEEEESHEREPEPEPVKSSRGRLKPTKATAPAAVAKKGRAGRPKNVDPSPAEEQEEPEERPAKRARKSLEPEAPKPSKGGRPKKTAAAPNPPKAKPAGRKPKLATISEADSPQVQRGPPMPRNNRGLFILRRETPMEGTGFKQTRSGRNSIKPLAYWKNERVEYSEDENEDNYGKFLLPRIKEVVRAEETEEPKRPKTKSRSTKSKKRAREPESEDDDETEPWETEPGRVIGEIRSWDPEDQTGSQAEEVEEEIALSSAAIITREIKDTTFRFAKTLTLPFFGSGMVDLPPGAIKKPKNSRKMQMVFFVFYGRVQVTVNDTVFRIGKGGMWQVPRGKTHFHPFSYTN
jgi:centromere protein C